MRGLACIERALECSPLAVLSSTSSPDSDAAMLEHPSELMHSGLHGMASTTSSWSVPNAGSVRSRSRSTSNTPSLVERWHLRSTLSQSQQHHTESVVEEAVRKDCGERPSVFTSFRDLMKGH